MGAKGDGILRRENVEVSAVEIAGVTDNRFVGLIKSCGKTYGFVVCPDLAKQFGKEDIFTHSSHLEGYQVGQEVSFSVIVNKEGRPQAISLEPADGTARKRPRT